MLRITHFILALKISVNLIPGNSMFIEFTLDIKSVDTESVDFSVQISYIYENSLLKTEHYSPINIEHFKMYIYKIYIIII